MRVVVGDRHFRTPAAFELGIVTAAGVIDFVFVGVKITRRWLARDGCGDLEQGIVRQQIIVVQQCHEFAGGYLESGVRRAGNVAVLSAENGFDAAIGASGRFQHPADVRLG